MVGTTITALLISVLFVSPVRAQTMRQMEADQGEILHQAQLKLQDAYKALSAKVAEIEPYGTTALEKAQHSWEQYRDDQCEVETFGTRFGSINSWMKTQCLTRLTSERTEVLEQQNSCPGGGMQCYPWWVH